MEGSKLNEGEDDNIPEELFEHLPEEIKKLPKEEQIQHLQRILHNFRRHEQMEHEQEELQRRYREKVAREYVPKHASLYQFQRNHFNRDLIQAIESGNPESIHRLIKPIGHGLYQVEFLNLEFCELLLDEVLHFENWCQSQGLSVNRPNSMNRYGAILDDFGFEDVLQEWVDQLISPLVPFVASHLKGYPLDRHHGFIVQYQIGKDTNLGFHVDDSEVTLNVCLGRKFTGGDLFFRGIRCSHHQNTPWRKDEMKTYSHRAGVAVFHLGKHRHGAYNIASGERYNLILWCRSRKYRQDLVQHNGVLIDADNDYHPPWCGYDELQEGENMSTKDN